MISDTICAVATGGASGAVALIRVSGPQAVSVFKHLVARMPVLEPRCQTLCTLLDGADVLDQALVTYFQAPHSFTGEEVVEIAIHGSSYIKGRLLELLCQHGARPARRGEFSQRAFLNGKIDLVEAQGICDVIAASNKAAHQLAMSQLDGKLSAHVENIKNTLTELLAQIEVRLDDVDEEMSVLSTSFVAQQLQRSMDSIRALADTFSVGKLIKDGLKVSLVGVPNSGKSSLLNALVGFDRAIVSEQSGTTRDTVEEVLEIDGQKIILTDTAGIREHTVDVAEQEGMRRSVRAMQQADVIVWVTDASLGLSQTEHRLWQQIKEQHKRIFIVRNKTDKTPVSSDLPSDTKGIPVVDVSCKTGQGIVALKKLLTHDMSAGQNSEGLLISNLRHYEALIKAQTELEEGLLRIDQGTELVAEHIRQALLHLKELIGEVSADTVLDVIFSKFCVGK